MSFRPFAVAVCALLCSLCLASCASGPRLAGITVQLVDLRPADMTLLETRAVMTLRYVNENVIALGLSGGSHRLFINGKYVGKGVSNAPVGLAAMSAVTQDVTINLENGALLSQLASAAREGAVHYRLESVLIQRLGDRRNDMKTSYEGSIDLSGLAQLKN
jgi:LEA14-like dessication related protein